MEGRHRAGVDLCVDPNSGSKDLRPMVDPILTVGKTVSLTLGSESLIVLDGNPTKKRRANCCGLTRGEEKKSSTQAIPFFNVLWAELDAAHITIYYATQASKDVTRATSFSYPVDLAQKEDAATWTENLLDRAYGPSTRRKRIKLLVNPHGGRGKAQDWYSKEIEPIFAAAQCMVDIEKTTHQGHAVEIAKTLDLSAYDVIACCSGDGIPHEVFNGLGKRKDAAKALAEVAVVQLPCGSGNAMSWNLYGTGSPSLAALGVVKGLEMPLDLVSITQGTQRTLSFLSQSVGLVAEADLGTENLRWLGETRFLYGVLASIMRKTVYPCDIAVKVEIDDKPAIRAHYENVLRNRAPASERREDRAAPTFDSTIEHGDGLPPLKFGSATDELPKGWDLVPYDKLGSFYAGNMAYMSAEANFFPAALPNDGCLDLVCMDATTSRMVQLQCLAAVQKGTLFDLEHVWYRKVVGYRIIPKGRSDGYIDVDGERIPFEPFQAEVHRGLGTTLSRTGHLYEASGVASRR